MGGQREVRFAMVTNVLAFFIHWFTAYLSTSYGMGLRGIAISTSIHFSIRFIIIYTITQFSRFKKTLIPLTDPDNFVNWKPQAILSLSSITMNIWAYWAFDVFTFIGTFMSVEIMAA